MAATGSRVTNVIKSNLLLKILKNALHDVAHVECLGAFYFIFSLSKYTI